MDTDRVVDVMGIIAGLGALIVVVLAWPRRRSAAVRRRHPSAGPPFSLAFDAAAPAWRFSVREGRPPVAIDIVTHRPAGSGEWVGEPFVEPVVVRPGATVAIDATVDGTTVVYDVVVAWTVLHPTGPVPGSRTLTVGETAPTPAAPRPGGSSVLAPRIALGSIALFLALITMVLGLRLFGGASEPGTPAPDAAPNSTTTETVVATTTPSPTSTSDDGPAPASIAVATPLTTEADTTTAATTTTATATTLAPPSTTTSTTATAATTSTTATTTTTSTTAVDGPAVTVDARVDDCRFGADCLIVGFELDGFDGSGEYVCEFGDGSRFVFRYVGNGADDACATGGDDPTITIEVDGVRSRTVTRATADGG